MRTSTTVYVGNMSFYTREEQVYEVFSKVGSGPARLGQGRALGVLGLEL